MGVIKMCIQIQIQILDQHDLSLFNLYSVNSGETISFVIQHVKRLQRTVTDIAKLIAAASSAETDII